IPGGHLVTLASVDGRISHFPSRLAVSAIHLFGVDERSAHNQRALSAFHDPQVDKIGVEFWCTCAHSMNETDPMVAVIAQGFAGGAVGAYFGVEHLLVVFKVRYLPNAESIRIRSLDDLRGKD